jgi:hypothetical protein
MVVGAGGSQARREARPARARSATSASGAAATSLIRALGACQSPHSTSAPPPERSIRQASPRLLMPIGITLASAAAAREPGT